ncbi:BMC_2a_G0023180.mRNA.1.CDS.1 [Saccharomyces cerevisiae]|nr:Pre9p [Saccharomyces cerevisiae YJM1447]CAI4469870.1 BMC_2a_G0023180.mRNA.1.CDS.1 [Saccharomyces cerevisiae]CAI4472052.1 BMB_G0023210.mRNA.1.CDS.1 [Saccharomyces cerevisiae]CAI7119458.1 BMC_2a_G0023180.mRNA.1.CDS.1 [Saccharomyces cerevisiae]CAI7120783.1 BMB_G0023210.mRNA.1.CDS.1 [Saccharomyces cerevisiae]
MGSRRYDSRTTIFSPEGRLYQVEYALESISHAGTAIGIMASDGIVLAAERKVTSTLLEQDTSTEKLYKLNDKIAVAVAGLTADAEILINTARIHAQNYLKTYNEDIPVEILVRRLSDIKQGYTQHGGLRPFGVSFIYAGYDDRYGYQLYTSNPSGNYTGWKAISVGANTSAAQTLLQMDYKDDMKVDDAIELALKTLSKTTDSSALTYDRLEFATIRKGANDGEMYQKIFKPQEIKDILVKTGITKKDEDEEADEDMK